MKRGDVVTVAAGGGFGSKPRPGLIIQDDAFASLGTAILSLFTSAAGTTPLSRPRFEPTPENGLKHASDLMIDILITVRRGRIGRVIGRLSDEEMRQVNQALTIFLGLGG